LGAPQYRVSRCGENAPKRKAGKQSKAYKVIFPPNFALAITLIPPLRFMLFRARRMAGSRVSTLPTFAHARNDRVAMHEALRVCGVPNSPSRTGENHSLTVVGSLDFQTRRLADDPRSAGREAALEVGLETCAAAVRRRDLTHNLSLSFVASCHR
jgi:hypothetical protein